MEGLPDPTSLDLFQYRDIRGTLQTLNPPDPELRPRVITDYVIDPAKWAAETVNTVEGVLTRAAGHPDRECLSCAGVGDYCLEPRDCIQSWRDAVASVGQSALEIRETGNMGLGVFATANIMEGDDIGEYLGELIPFGFYAANPEIPGDYAFAITNIGISASHQFGNWTRFVNHGCGSIMNVKAQRQMIGRRMVMVYRAIRDIGPDEQLFVDYGSRYFAGREMQCLCPAFEGAHDPQDPSVAAGDDASGPAEAGARDPDPPTIQDDAINEVRPLRNNIRARIRSRGGATNRRNWSTKHWERLNDLVQTFRSEYYEIPYVNENAKFTYGNAYAQFPVGTEQQTVMVQGQNYDVERWHEDVIDAFNNGKTGDTRWDREDLAKRILSLVLTEERRRLRVVKRLALPTLPVDSYFDFTPNP